MLALSTVPAVAASRVISLAPSMTELMLELGAGDLLVGVLDGGQRPAELAHLPSVGDAAVLEMERVLSLSPDLILLWPDSVRPAQREQLRRFGIPVLESAPQDLDALATLAETVATRIGRAEDGARLAADFRRDLAELRMRYRRETPLAVFYQVWDAPLYTLGGRQIISDALAVCGARNLFADLDLPAPQVSLESVLARDPEVILTRPSLVAAWQVWPQLRAVRRGQIWSVPDAGLERPSLQMLGATARLCELLARAR